MPHLAARFKARRYHSNAPRVILKSSFSHASDFVHNSPNDAVVRRFTSGHDIAGTGLAGSAGLPDGTGRCPRDRLRY